MQKQQKEFEVAQGHLKFEKSGERRRQELLQLICLCKPNLMT